MFKFLFSDIGEGVHEGKLTELSKKVGENIKDGETLFIVETDKMTADIPSPVNGKIANWHHKVGDTIHVGDLVVEIDDGSASTQEPVAAKTHHVESTKEIVEEKKSAGASVVGEVEVSDRLFTFGNFGAPKAPVATKQETKTTSSSDNGIDPNFPGKTYDLFVIGAGPGGYVGAIRASMHGLKVGIAEEKWFGGVCLNVGCIPTKTLLKSAKVLSEINHSSDYGIDLNSKEVNINWTKVLERKNKVVKTLTTGVQGLLKRNKVDLYNGTAVAITKNIIQIGNEKIQCKNLLIASGSKVRMMPIDGLQSSFDAGFVISSTEALNLPSIPKTLCVIGGGVIGLEFATLYRAFGTEVTVVEFLPEPLGPLDKDIKKGLLSTFQERGIKFHFNSSVQKIEHKSNGGSVTWKEVTTNQMTTQQFEKTLLCVGREPVLGNGFDKIGLELNKPGYIVTNNKCETNIPGVFAIGDITGIKQLAHKASEEGLIVANNLAGGNETINVDTVPGCIYTFPEAAFVGLTEEELTKKGITNFVVGKADLKSNGKAMCEEENYGFVKIIADKTTGEIYGAHILGHSSTDMIAEIAVAIKAELTVNDIGNTMHPHPTVSEAIMEAANGCLGQKIH